MSASKPLQKRVDEICKQQEKINAELLIFTYGSLVVQLIKDFNGNIAKVNKQLDKIGYDMGIRLVEDYLCKTNPLKCANLNETAEHLKAAFKIYLNCSVNVKQANNNEISLVLDDNPLVEFVDGVPADLIYCNLFTGAIRGALESVNLETEVSVVSDAGKGEKDEIKIKLNRVVEDEVPASDD